MQIGMDLKLTGIRHRCFVGYRIFSRFQSQAVTELFNLDLVGYMAEYLV